LRVANASREGNQQGTPRPATPADVEMNPSGTGSREVAVDHSQPRWDGDDANQRNTADIPAILTEEQPDEDMRSSPIG
jgi:hypothetical protein